MRVLELVTSANWGGAQAQVVQYAAELDRRGAAVMIACGEEGPLLLRAAAMGLAVHRLRWMRTPPNPRADVLARIEVEELLHSYHPDIIHTHSSKAGVIGRLAAAKTMSASGARPAVIHHCHGLAWGAGSQTGLSGELYRRVERATGHLCDGVISVSNSVQRQLLSDGTYPAARHVVVHNGIEPGQPGNGPFTSSSEQRRLLGLPTSGALIAHVGRVVRGKGHEQLIAATAALAEAGRDVNLLIIGDGPLASGLRNMTAQEGELSSRVHFLGFRTDVPAVLRTCDVLCLPSASEGLPLAVLEAMAASLPVVATCVGGIPELVIPGETGILVGPAAKPDELAQAIEWVLDDHQRAAAMGRAGRSRCEESFSLRNSALAVDFLYEMHSAIRAAA